ncbi:MAG: ThiF family adenylyltransferase [Candidatus Egerieousia sp.]
MSQEWKERTLLQVGEDGIKALEEARIAIVGLGGVGAYAAEMLCRAGVGSFVLADSDVISETNKNRQLLALDSTIGEKKTTVIFERMRDINNLVQIDIIDEFLTEENIGPVFGDALKSSDFVIDAIDTLTPKIALIKFCIDNRLPLVSSMGAGAKYDATKVRLADIKNSFNCPLAYMLRKRLHKIGIRSGFNVVFSEEKPIKEAIIPMEERNKKSRTGTVSYLPAVFGCVCAQAAIQHILRLVY